MIGVGERKLLSGEVAAVHAAPHKICDQEGLRPQPDARSSTQDAVGIKEELTQMLAHFFVIGCFGDLVGSGRGKKNGFVHVFQCAIDR